MPLETINTVVLQDREYGPDGKPLVNQEVTVRLGPGVQFFIAANQAGNVDQVALQPVELRVKTDATGFWSIPNIVRNSDITPAGTFYTVKVGLIKTYDVSIPAGAGPFIASQQAIGALSAFPGGSTVPGPVTINGNLTVTGSESVSGLLTALAGLSLGGVLSPNTGTTIEELSAGNSAIFQVDNDRSVQFAFAELVMRHTANALANAGHEAWIAITDRPAAGGVGSNTRWYLQRVNPAGSIVQTYLLVDDTGRVHIADPTMFVSGVPNPGLSGVSLGRVLVSPPGPAPTMGALQTNITAQSISGSDISATISLTTGATPPGPGSTIGIVNYGTSFGGGASVRPIIGNTTAITVQAFTAFSSLSQMSIGTAIAMAASTQYNLISWVVGTA